MNLEQIDTSTTAGKAEVMRLAAEGRRVASRLSESRSRLLGIPQKWEPCSIPIWNWRRSDYAIISEPVGPEEVWVLLGKNGSCADVTEVEDCFSDASNSRVVRYIRADLAGEKS